MTLRGDGTFTTVAWPADLEGPTGATDGRSGSGRWELDEAGPDDCTNMVTFSSTPSA
ncbi:hypothetical protein [Streptomyces sp. NPDC091217]|uniref:hypothetical protein n=1 Tax=Streptomyces sp. NPDC091217 TaxID=3365975 RepID=UPI003822CB55